jgi:hypothetical protein
MTFRSILFLGAIASCALLAAGDDARAGYTFTTGLVSATPAPAGVADTFTPNSGASPVDSPTSVSLVTVDYTTGSATPVSGTQTLSWTESLTSTTTGQTETFVIFGPLTIFNSSTLGGVAANFVAPTIMPVSGSGFGLTFTGYSPTPGSMGRTADFGFIITPPSAVPEPASMAILGTGLVSVIGFALRRRKAAKA